MEINLSVQRRLIFYLFLLIFIGSNVKNSYAQLHQIKKENKWIVELSFKSAYDNNILKYSDKYLDRFVNNKDEGRFHINTYDDIVLDYSARLFYSSNRIITNQRSILSARIDYTLYSFNAIKTWLSYDFGWQQFLSKKTSFMISYTRIPDFYIAHYRDEDWTEIYGYTPETYQSYSYSKDEYNLWIQHAFSNAIKVRFYFSYLEYFYNQHFTEYDSNNLMFGCRVFNQFNNKITVDAGYKYITSNAKGFDETNETKETSDDNDATYYEHVFSAGCEYNLPKIFFLKNAISFSADFITRYYLTDHSGISDPLHAGRNDFSYRLYFSYDVDIHNNVTAGIFFNYLFRNADTSIKMNKVYVSNEKDYNQFQLGLDFNYKIQF